LEKIVSAYESVHDHHLEEDAVLVKCKAAASYVEKMEKDFHNGCNFGKEKDDREIMLTFYGFGSLPLDFLLFEDYKCLYCCLHGSLVR
jgi:hypothetical protein